MARARLPGPQSPGRRPVKTSFEVREGREKPGVYGGTFRVDDVFVGSKKVGTIQVQVKKGRVDVEPYQTCMPSGINCVVGYHPEWLVRGAGFAGARCRRR